MNQEIGRLQNPLVMERRGLWWWLGLGGGWGGMRWEGLDGSVYGDIVLRRHSFPLNYCRRKECGYTTTGSRCGANFKYRLRLLKNAFMCSIIVRPTFQVHQNKQLNICVRSFRSPELMSLFTQTYNITKVISRSYKRFYGCITMEVLP